MAMSAVDLYKREQALNASKPKNAASSAVAQQTANSLKSGGGNTQKVSAPASNYAASYGAYEAKQANQKEIDAYHKSMMGKGSTYVGSNNSSNQKEIDAYHKSMMGKGSYYAGGSSSKSSTGSSSKASGGGSVAVASGGAGVAAGSSYVGSSTKSSKSGGSSGGRSKKSGINTKAAKKAYNELGTELNALVNHLNTLVSDVQDMNKNVWYGGKKANTWYTNMNARYENVYAYCKGINSFRDSLGSVFKKAKANGIDFG